MKEFLADNVALTQRLEELQPSPGGAPSPWLTRASTARMREINSPSQWALCWLMFASIQCRDPKLWGILAHGCIVLQLAQRHSGTGWLEYDRIFRHQAASDPSIPWNVLNPSLMAMTVLATSPTGPSNTICPHCQAADHRREDCALLSVDPFLDTARQPGSSRPPPTIQTRPPKPRYTPYGTPGANEPCRRYNRGVYAPIPPPLAATGMYVAIRTAWHQATQLQIVHSQRDHQGHPPPSPSDLCGHHHPHLFI